MEVNVFAVLVATAVMFGVGAVWYGLIFGKVWASIHGFDKLSASEQKAIQAKMGLPYLAQLLVTFVMIYVFAHLLESRLGVSFYELAIWLWLGFIVPTHASDVLFGGTPGKYVAKKLTILVLGSLVSLLAGAWILTLF
ncbi:MAG: DUF1761 domain-containing protein [Candidatus Saccharimonas sp.]